MITRLVNESLYLLKQHQQSVSVCSALMWTMSDHAERSWRLRCWLWSRGHQMMRPWSQRPPSVLLTAPKTSMWTPREPLLTFLVHNKTEKNWVSLLQSVNLTRQMEYVLHPSNLSHVSVCKRVHRKFFERGGKPDQIQIFLCQFILLASIRGF